MMYFPEKKQKSYSEPQNPQNPMLDVNINMFHLFIVSEPRMVVLKIDMVSPSTSITMSSEVSNARKRYTRFLPMDSIAL